MIFAEEGWICNFANSFRNLPRCRMALAKLCIKETCKNLVQSVVMHVVVQTIPRQGHLLCEYYLAATLLKE